MSGVRLNRYLALAGFGTRRSVERLIGSGRVAVGGEPARDPAIRVEPGEAVTLDGNPLEVRDACGVLVRLQGGVIPPLAHPAALHLAGRSHRHGTAVLLSDDDLARKLLAQGYDPARAGRHGPRAGRVPAALAGRARGREGLRAARIFPLTT